MRRIDPSKNGLKWTEIEITWSIILSIKQIYNKLQYCRKHGSIAPTLGKGTKCIKLLCSQASKDKFSPLISMHFPVFWAHLRKTELLYSMQTWKELCDKMAISWLKVAKTWANWRLSCHMQGFQQAWRRRIPFLHTLANFPSNALIFSPKCSPTFPQTLAGT